MTDDGDKTFGDDVDEAKKEPPEKQDEEAFSGEMAALESDDDVDEVGEVYGVEYKDMEELNVARKVAVETEPEPPTEDKPAD